MPTLIIEDGTGVANANTYLSVVDAETILDNLGYALDVSLNDDQKSQYLIRSAYYLESFRRSYSGDKNSSTQGLQWPRSNACIDNYPIGSDFIPLELKQAQALGAYYESIGKSLQAVTDGRSIASKEVAGAVKVSYFDNGSIHNETKFNDINDLLRSLFRNGGALRVTRV